MGFRDYQPSINRFTVRDSYNGALSDLNLGTDPWTANRYAFVGGNPIGLIEYDGHMPIDEFEQQEQKRLGGDNSSMHNDVVAATGALIQMQEQLLGTGGEVSLDLGPGAKSKNLIPGGAKDGSGGNGYADIILWRDDAVYVWEVKPGTTNPVVLAEYRAQLNRYVTSLQEDLRKKGDNRPVFHGFSLPTQDPIPTRGGFARAWSHPSVPADEGLRFYGAKRKKKDDQGMGGQVLRREVAEPGAVDYVVGGGQVVLGTVTIVGTLVEDVGTGGLGIMDDPLTIGFGSYQITQGLQRIGVG